MSNDTTYPRVLGIEQPKQCVATRCNRCGGAGGYQGWPGWTCYRCGGNGQDPTYRDFGFPPAWTDEQCASWTAERDARNAASRKRAADKRQAKADAARQSAIAAYPVIATLDRIRQASASADDGTVTAVDPITGLHWADFSTFVSDVFWKACRDGYTLSDRQVAALERSLEQALAHVARKQAQAAERATAEPVPTGRQTIEGRVVSLKWYEGDYGSTQKAMLVGDAGWRVFVSVPSKASWGVGDRVRVTCEITPAEDDRTFGKGKRPTKPETLEQAPDQDEEV